MNKRYLYIFIVVILCVLTGAIIMLVTNKNEQSVIPIDYAETGAFKAEKLPGEKNIEVKYIELYKRLPVEGNGFRIEFNTREEKYRVTLSPDYAQSKQSAEDWLKTNGYGNLPTDAFEFILDGGMN
jgi:hypothetical protein